MEHDVTGYKGRYCLNLIEYFVHLSSISIPQNDNKEISGIINNTLQENQRSEDET